MPVVRSCSNALGAVDDVRLGEERRLSTGTVRRYVSYDRGHPILIQLPICFTPGGMVYNFDEGARMSLVPNEPPGIAEVDCLVELCFKIRARFELQRPDSEWEWDSCIEATTREVSVRSARVRDVRVFESEDLSADECPVGPGDTVTAIVSPDYVWRSASGTRAGLNLRLVQLLLHTDRGSYTSCLIPCHRPASVFCEPRSLPPPPPPPPMPRRAAAKAPPPGFRPSVMDIVTARNSLRKI